MKRFYFTLFLLIFSYQLVAQSKNKKIKLPAELNEISGIEKLNDTILIAINDSGNSPEIFFINLEGKIIHKTIVSNALNNDWEDLTTDNDGNLYIADVGNNSNQRNDLCILKVNALEAFRVDAIKVEKISLNYTHRINSPVAVEYNAYDCEAIYWLNDSLYLLTKLRSKPAKNDEMNGTFVYVFSSAVGSYNLGPSNHYWTGGNNKLKHQVTACDQFGEELAILTYGFIYFYRIGLPRETPKESIKFKRLTQKEALVYLSANKIIVAAEKHWLLGGPFLYTIDLK